MAKYIYQSENWNDFTWNEKQISILLAQVRNLQGRLLGKMGGLGFGFQAEATLEMITLDILKSSEIEGEKLNKAQVRSSIARRLGIDTAGLVTSAKNIDGIVEMMLDATQRYETPLNARRSQYKLRIDAIRLTRFICVPFIKNRKFLFSFLR